MFLVLLVQYQIQHNTVHYCCCCTRSKEGFENRGFARTHEMLQAPNLPLRDTLQYLVRYNLPDTDAAEAGVHGVGEPPWPSEGDLHTREAEDLRQRAPRTTHRPAGELHAHYCML